MPKFSVPEVNYFVLVEKIEKLNSKAAKLGTEPITLDVLGSRFEDWTNPEGNKVPVKIIDIEVVGKAPVLNGWKLAAKLEHAPAGNVIYSLLDEDLPERFRTVEPWCEYCKTVRYRVNTYVVLSEAGEFQQVGSSCLKDFTGHANPEALAKWAEYIMSLYDDCEEGGWDPDTFGGSSNYIELAHFLDNAAAVIRAHGWTSRGDVYDGTKQGPASADLAVGNMNASKYASWKVDVTEADRALVEKVIEWVRTDVANREEHNDYLWNLAVSFSDDYISYKQVGIVASAISAYKREQERKAKEANEKASEYVGTVKKRQVFNDLKLVFSTSWANNYGYNAVTYLYKFQDKDGNILVWKTANFYEWFDGETVVSGKATVKEHSEYNGVKQTILTRPKFEVVEG